MNNEQLSEPCQEARIPIGCSHAFRDSLTVQRLKRGREFIKDRPTSEFVSGGAESEPEKRSAVEM